MKGIDEKYCDPEIKKKESHKETSIMCKRLDRIWKVVFRFFVLTLQRGSILHTVVLLRNSC